MRLLLLGPLSRRLVKFMTDCETIVVEAPIEPDFIRTEQIDTIVSFGYRHILRAESLNAVNGLAFNLHISLLPWNRGAHPNLWSWLEGTPTGVSVHWMTAGLDQGDLVAQRGLELSPSLTLRESHEALLDDIEGLFGEVWDSIRQGEPSRNPQAVGGSYHTTAQGLHHLRCLPAGWDSRCDEVAEYGRRSGLRLHCED